jgi:hypothetical protein
VDDERRSSFSLRRWSRRKLEAARGQDDSRAPRRNDDDVAPAAKRPAAEAVPARSVAAPGTSDARSDIPPTPPAVESTRLPLPPIDSLTIDSDFSPFMQAGVDETVKREALRKLVRDPRFNVMDGLDVYIDDYSKPSPLEPALARALTHARYVFNPPKTRVTAEGIVEDIREPTEREGDDAAAEAPPSAAAEVTQRVASLESPQPKEPSAAPPASEPAQADKRIE